MRERAVCFRGGRHFEQHSDFSFFSSGRFMTFEEFILSAQIMISWRINTGTKLIVSVIVSAF